jgi:hypothetical protein
LLILALHFDETFTEIPALGAVEGKLHKHLFWENALVVCHVNNHAILFGMSHV